MISTVPAWYKEQVLTDWKERVPWALTKSKLTGFMRTCFQLEALLYYIAKDLVLLYVCFPVFIIKLCTWDLVHIILDHLPEPEEGEVEEEEEPEEVDELAFCQIFNLDDKTDLHIIRVEYCPDETAFIRTVSEEAYTTPYKRKVKRDKRGSRYISFNNQNFYLDDKKTQPVMPEVKK